MINSNDITSGHEVLFYTTPTTPRELKAATTSQNYESLFKNESAIGNVGQLQFVQEPAGKLRVFAMTDCFTQSIMQPVHRLLTSILKKIPNDGTSNQNASYARARQKALEHKCSYGYDLSAATDRLPIALQESILAGVFTASGYKLEVALHLARL